jgi:TP901 family phage tail tape measure protein
MGRARVLNIIYTGNPAGAVAANKAVAGSTASTMGVLAKGGAAMAGFSVAGVVALAAVGSSFDKAYDKIRIGTGATGKELEGLKSDFKGVARNSGASFDKIGQTVADLNTRLGTTGKPLQTLTRQFLFLDARGIAPLETTIPAVTRLFGDWSVAVEDQAGTLDTMFRASQATGIGVDRLAELMVQFGSPLRQLGLSFEFTTAMFSRFEKEGVNISTALPGLRMALKNFAKAGKEPAPALMETFKAIRDTGSLAEANTMAFDIFGARAGPDLAAAIREGRFDLDELMATIANGKDTILGVADDTSSLSQKLGILKNRVLVGLEPVAIKVFDALSDGAARMLEGWDAIAPTVGRVMGAIRGWVDNVSRWWADHGPAIVGAAQSIGKGVLRAGEMIKNAAQTIVRNWDRIRGPVAAAAKVIGAVMIPVLIRLGVQSTISAAKQAAAWLVTSTASGRAKAAYIKDTLVMVARWAWMGVQALAHAAKIAAAWLISLGPIGLVIAAVAAVALIVVKNFDTIKRVISGVWEWIRDHWKQIFMVLTGPIGLAVVAIISHWDKIKGAFFAALHWVLDAVKTGWHAVQDATLAVWNAIGTFISFIWGRIKSAVATAVNAVRATVSAVFNAVRNGVSVVWNAIKDLISNAWAGIKIIVQSAVALVKLYISTGFNAAKTVALTIFRAIRDTLSGIWESIKTKVRDAAQWIKDQVSGKFTAVKDAILNAFRGVRDAMGSIWNAVKNKVRTPVNAIIGFINTLIGGIDRVLEILPGNLSLDYRIPQMGSGGIVAGTRASTAVAGMARGGVAPFVTDGVRAIVGEGNPRYPEYVIPTDPQYRNRATMLLAQAAARVGGIPMYGIGGVIGDIGDAIKSAVGGAVGTFRKGAAMAIFGPAKAVFDRAIGQVPWKFLRQIGGAFSKWIYDFVKGVDDKGTTGGGAPGGPFAGGSGVERWRGVALQALSLAGQAASWVNDLLRQMQHESGGNPRAINLWDSNARRGTPSMGLMQTIRPTFDAYAGHLQPRGPWDPLANIYAAIRYTVSRYGSLGAWRQRGFKGYRSGAWEIFQDQFAQLHRGEMVVPEGPASDLRGMATRRTSGRDGPTIVIENMTVVVPEGTRDPQAFGRRVERGFEDALTARRIHVDARIK